MGGCKRICNHKIQIEESKTMYKQIDLINKT